MLVNSDAQISDLREHVEEGSIKTYFFGVSFYYPGKTLRLWV